MKKIRIEKVHIESFKGIRSKTFTFDGKSATVAGRNATGKSTIADAVCWVLFDKMADGSSANKIRPIKPNGEVENYKQISVELDITVDGQPMKLTKAQRQKWVRPRGKAESEFQGNENYYEINAVGYTEKAFKVKLAEVIDEETFKLGSVLGAFLVGDVKKRRANLMQLASGFDAMYLLEANPELAPLSEIFASYTPQEALALAQSELKTAKRELDEIPIRIDELEKSIVDGNLIWERGVLAKLKREEEESDTEKVRVEIARLKTEIAELQADANTKFLSEKATLDGAYFEARREYDKVCADLRKAEFDYSGVSEKVKTLTTEKIKAQNTYVKTYYSRFDSSATACPTCKRRYTEHQMEMAKQEFSNNRKRELEELNAKGQELADKINALVVEQGNLEEEIERLTLQRKDCYDAYVGAEEAIKELQTHKVDTSELEARLAEEEKRLEELTAGDKESLAERIAAQEKLVAALSANENVKKKITEYEARKTEVAQAQANAEKKLALIEAFNRARYDAITEEINKHFKLVKWKLFETQINGGIKDVCDATIDGVAIGNGLNQGHTILAEIDICEAMQAIYDVSLPIFIDNAESLSPDSIGRIDTSDKQYIFLRVEDQELEVRIDA